MTARNNLTAMYVRCYKENPESLVHIVYTQVSKRIMLETYRAMVREGEILPVEKLPLNEKTELRDECNKTGLMFTNVTLTDAARILHTLKFINKNL